MPQQLASAARLIDQTLNHSPASPVSPAASRPGELPGVQASSSPGSLSSTLTAGSVPGSPVRPETRRFEGDEVERFPGDTEVSIFNNEGECDISATNGQG